MNIQLHLDDADWTTFIAQIRSALAASDTMLKRAFLIVWPKEGARIFDSEQGPDGPWAPWAESTRKARIAHEQSKTSARQRAFARTAFIREGGRLLQVTGALRKQTVLDPEMIDLPNGLQVVSPTPYSGFLDEGTSRMPARPFMYLGDDAQETLARIFVDQLWDKVGGTD